MAFIYKIIPKNIYSFYGNYGDNQTNERMRQIFILINESMNELMLCYLCVSINPSLIGRYGVEFQWFPTLQTHMQYIKVFPVFRGSSQPISQTYETISQSIIETMNGKRVTTK